MPYDNTNSGALFKNARKDKESHPDYNGTLNVGGTDYWLNAWIKKSKDGKTYMSVSVQPKVDASKKEPARTAGSDDDLGEPPFLTCP